jgi:translation initiation factor 2 subunit 2
MNPHFKFSSSLGLLGRIHHAEDHLNRRRKLSWFKKVFNIIVLHVNVGGSHMEYDYEKLLKRARSQIPEVTSKIERLEIPKLRHTRIGVRTIISNFKEVADALNRDPQHMLKFLSGEMATAATIQGSRIIFQGKFSQETFDRLMDRYMESFVICPVCKRPDTKIIKEKRLSFLVCEACGARSSIKQL